MNDTTKALAALAEAKGDITRLEELSNQFRTCYLLIDVKPSGSATGDPEIKDFMEEKRSRYENMELEELISVIDLFQTHLALAGRLAREKSKIKIASDVAAKNAKEKNEAEAYRAAKTAKREGKVFVDATDGEPVRNPLVGSTEPIDKKMHKAIQGLMKSFKIDYAKAKKMLEGMNA